MAASTLSSGDKALDALVKSAAFKQQELKIYIRTHDGSAEFRRFVWLFASNAQKDLPKAKQTLETMRHDTFGGMFQDGLDIHHHQEAVPLFGSDLDRVLRIVQNLADSHKANPSQSSSPDSHTANAKPENFGDLQIKQNLMLLLCLLHSEFPEVEYCPQLPAFVSLLLLSLPPEEALLVLTSIIKQDKKLQPKFHFTLTRTRWNALVHSMFSIAMDRLPSIKQHFATIGVKEKHIRPLLQNMFLDVLPVETMSSILSSFIFEGNKVLLRILIAFFQLQTEAILKLKDVEEFCEFIDQDKHVDPPPRNELVKEAFGIWGLSKADVGKRIEKLRGTTRRVSTSLIGKKSNNRFFVPKFPPNSRTMIASDAQLLHLWTSLPEPSLRKTNPLLLFSTEHHGYSLQTLYRLCETAEKTILVIQDVDNNVFGGFANSPWSLKTRISGTSSCFLFSFSFPENHTNNNNHVNLVSFQATGKNQLYQITAPHSLQMGGGGDGAGLHIDGDLHEGTTVWCETFDNDPLVVNGKETFSISRVEVWTFAES